MSRRSWPVHPGGSCCKACSQSRGCMPHSTRLDGTPTYSLPQVKLSSRTIEDLAYAICGGTTEPGDRWAHFPYRSSRYLSRFFEHCDQPDRHKGETRFPWVKEILDRLNGEPSPSPVLPSSSLIRVVQELLDEADYNAAKRDRAAALETLNSSLKRDGLEAFIDSDGRGKLRHVNSGLSSGDGPAKRRWTHEEERRRSGLEKYIADHSEDDLIENVLSPAFSQLGFQRLTVAGHKDKALEFGKDMWMKYRLPTGHFIFFGVQVKKRKIDSAGKSAENVSEVLNQVRMMLEHPIFDKDVSRRVLLDHVYVASGGEITKQAQEFLIQKLDRDGRRTLIFLDRQEILDMVIGCGVRLPNVPLE